MHAYIFILFNKNVINQKFKHPNNVVMPKSEDLSRSLEINANWTFDTEFPTIFNKSCTYIIFRIGGVSNKICRFMTDHNIFKTLFSSFASECIFNQFR